MIAPIDPSRSDATPDYPSRAVSARSESGATRFGSDGAGATRPGSDRRADSDRRQEPTSPWGALPPAGRRMRFRRASEHCRAYFVDRFSPTMWAFVLMLLTATLVDALLTLRVIEAGGDEINPLMDRLLGYGVVPFVLGKYLLTVIGLPLLLIFKNFRLFGTRLRAGHLIPLVVGLYLVLIAYQLTLLAQPL